METQEVPSRSCLQSVLRGSFLSDGPLPGCSVGWQEDGGIQGPPQDRQLEGNKDRGERPTGQPQRPLGTLPLGQQPPSALVTGAAPSHAYPVASKHRASEF